MKKVLATIATIATLYFGLGCSENKATHSENPLVGRVTNKYSIHNKNASLWGTGNGSIMSEINAYEIRTKEGNVYVCSGKADPFKLGDSVRVITKKPIFKSEVDIDIRGKLTQISGEFVDSYQKFKEE